MLKRANLRFVTIPDGMANAKAVTQGRFAYLPKVD